MSDIDQEQIHPFDREYCDWCEIEGHTFSACPRRDDESLWEEDEEGT